MEYFGIVITGLFIAAGLAFIPAAIAKNKGYSFGMWWLYGWLLWIAAIIHVCCIRDKNAQQIPVYQYNSVPYSPPSNAGQSAADEIKKYKELLDQGMINEEEYRIKKEQLLNLR